MNFWTTPQIAGCVTTGSIRKLVFSVGFVWFFFLLLQSICLLIIPWKHDEENSILRAWQAPLRWLMWWQIKGKLKCDVKFELRFSAASANDANGATMWDLSKESDFYDEAWHTVDCVEVSVNWWQMHGGPIMCIIHCRNGKCTHFTLHFTQYRPRRNLWWFRKCTASLSDAPEKNPDPFHHPAMFQKQ